MSVSSRANKCQDNDRLFTVITPSATSYYNIDGNTFHTQGLDDIGIKMYLFLVPNTVNFHQVWAAEGLANYSASGGWKCDNNTAHEFGPVFAQGVSTVTSQGTQLNGAIDTSYTDSCDHAHPNSPEQYQGSNISITIPTIYSMTSSDQGFPPFGSVTMNASESATSPWSMYKAKGSAQGSVAGVNSPNSPY